MQYEQDAWVENARSNAADINDIVAAFEAILQYNALFYERLPEQNWQRTGWNDGNEVSVADLFQGFIRHVQNHLGQIDRTKAAFAQR
ncbi:DinB family protein [Paenibacillus chartarius]|uniref:DinB family protein n=1 Tax=Paenibacillus chartarius TaxID=747481 RepID=A0ABV6DGN8_9BACL